MALVTLTLIGLTATRLAIKSPLTLAVLVWVFRGSFRPARPRLLPPGATDLNPEGFLVAGSLTAHRPRTSSESLSSLGPPPQ